MQKIYKPSLLMQISGVLGGLVCLVLMAYSFSHRGNEPLAATLFMSGFFAVVGGLLLKNGTEKISLADGAVEARNLFWTRRLQFGDIAGWSVIPSGGGRSTVTYALRILPLNKEQDKPVPVSANVRIDANFRKWLEGFPNQTTTRIFDQMKTLKEQAQRGDEKAAAKVATIEKMSRLPVAPFRSPEDMTARYFRQSGL